MRVISIVFVVFFIIWKILEVVFVIEYNFVITELSVIVYDYILGNKRKRVGVELPVLVFF